MFKNTTTYEVDVDVEGLSGQCFMLIYVCVDSFFSHIVSCTASELYEWGIYNRTVYETETMSCGNKSYIYDPFDMIERSCNYEKDCSESIEK